jgi:hypothetical protein
LHCGMLKPLPHATLVEILEQASHSVAYVS